jgi:hypothetical protein
MRAIMDGGSKWQPKDEEVALVVYTRTDACADLPRRIAYIGVQRHALLAFLNIRMPPRPWRQGPLCALQLLTYLSSFFPRTRAWDYLCVAARHLASATSLLCRFRHVRSLQGSI